MPGGQIALEIDDAQTVDQNIALFVEHLKTLDGPMADVLAAVLPNLSHDMEINQGEVLDALYAAIAPPTSQPEEAQIPDIGAPQ